MTTPPEEVVAEQKRKQRSNGLVLIGVALVLAVALGFVYRTDHQVQIASQRSDTLEQQVVANGKLAQEAKEGVEEANRRLRAAGKPTVPVPTVSPISPPPSGSGEKSLTIEQVRAVVLAELAQYKVQLTQAEISQIAKAAAALIPKPVDGKTPTAAQLQTYAKVAMATYCLEGRCQGKPGESIKGDQGERGPKVTDEELLRAAQTALAAYCAQDNKPCRGEPGAASTIPGPLGPMGPGGEQGRSVVDTDCMEDGRWRITYDKPFPDGETVRYSRGPCRVVVLPTN